MTPVVIESISIRQDGAGRYSLNDLHRAAGGERRHGPSVWLENQQTQELIAEVAQEVGDTGIPVSVQRGGIGQGTYVCRELVYAYAMWIHPAFHLRVIRTFDSVIAGAMVPRTMAAALRLAADQAEQLEAARPAVEFVERYVDATGSMGFRQVCKLLHANENRFREFLLDQRIMYRLGGEWTPYQEHIDAGRFEVKAGVARANDHAFNQARFTPKGVQWVAGLWARALCEVPA